SLIPSASADIQKTERPRADERATLTAPAWLKWYIEALKESHSASETQTAGATTEQESINEEPTLMRNVHLAPADDAVMAAYLYIVEHRREDRRDNWTQFDGAVRESDYSRRVRDFELSINELLDVLDSSD
ncbi:MAG: hypothetical protein KDA33_02720, partial [Phycisphaerales bacterium]|nr:hypothetical protein [Phycisphaerales bacterium]